MNQDQLITSLHNPHLKTLIGLRKRSERDASKSFVIEGFRPLARALDNNIALYSLYYSPEWFLGSNEMDIIDRARAMNTKCIRLGREAFAKVAYRDRPEGLLAIAPQWHTSLSQLQLSDPPFLLVIEAIEKPGNLGTIVRSADAAGVDAVLVCDPVTDLFNPNVVRSSTGTLFSVPICSVGSDQALEYMHSKRIKIVATTPDASLVYTDCELRGPLALVMGSEQFGLSSFWLDAADEKIRIPMNRQADSLNVAMATLIALFEALRQRSE